MIGTWPCRATYGLRLRDESVDLRSLEADCEGDRAQATMQTNWVSLFPEEAIERLLGLDDTVRQALRASAIWLRPR